MSQIIEGLNELFVSDELGESDVVSGLYGVRDILRGNTLVMEQMANNSREQALLGDFYPAVDDAIIDSPDVHDALRIQLLSDPRKARLFALGVFDLLKNG